MTEESNETLQQPAAPELPEDVLSQVVFHSAMSDWYALVTYMLQPPTAQQASELAQASMGDDVRAIAAELGADTESAERAAAALDAAYEEFAESDDVLGLVRREYTRVFRHPKHPVIKPYEGVFCDVERVAAGKTSTDARLFVNPSSIDARNRYREAGFKYPAHALPADYMSVELEFASKMHANVAKALVQGSAERAEEANARLLEFKRERLAQWMPRLFERCENECELTFYRAAGKTGAALMAFDPDMCQRDGSFDTFPMV